MVCITELAMMTLKRENFQFREDIVVLSASGTAVVGNLNYMLDLVQIFPLGRPAAPRRISQAVDG